MRWDSLRAARPSHTLFEGAEKWGKRRPTSRQACAAAQARPPRLSPPGGSPRTPRVRGPPPPGRRSSPRTLPSPGGHASAGPGQGPAPAAGAPRLASSPDPAGPPSSAFSAPHLLGRHRPLPRAAAAALGGATAALRHLRRLPGFRRAARPRRASLPASASAARPAPPPPLGCPAPVPRAAVDVASCRPYPRPAGCGDFPLRTPPRERRGGGGRVPRPRPPRGGGNEGGRPCLGGPGLGRDCAASVQLRRCAGRRRGGENPGSSSKVTRGAETSGRGQGLGLMREREVVSWSLPVTHNYL